MDRFLDDLDWITLPKLDAEYHVFIFWIFLIFALDYTTDFLFLFSVSDVILWCTEEVNTSQIWENVTFVNILCFKMYKSGKISQMANQLAKEKQNENVNVNVECPVKCFKKWKSTKMIGLFLDFDIFA